MKISAIITTCKGDLKLIRAIDSVLNQTYDDLEVIVVDDNGRGSEDQLKTQRMLSRYKDDPKVRYIVHEKNRNGAVARNTGASYADGDHFAFLDDDDFYLPDRFAKFAEIVEEKNADVIYSGVFFLSGNEIIYSMKAEEKGFTWKDILVDQSLLGTGSNIFLSRKAYEAVDGFDGSFLRYQDVEFMTRVLCKFKITGINDGYVVKDISCSRFYPNYKNFVCTQQNYIDKFKPYIRSLTREAQRSFYFNKRSELLFSAFTSKNRFYIKEAYSILKHDAGKLSAKELLKIKCKEIELFYFEKPYKCFCDAKSSIKAKIVKAQMSDRTLKYIDRILTDTNMK